jgi:hypothetical protein
MLPEGKIRRDLIGVAERRTSVSRKLLSDGSGHFSNTNPASEHHVAEYDHSVGLIKYTVRNFALCPHIPPINRTKAVR